MKVLIKYLASFFQNRFGALSLGAFLLTLLSGIFLLVPYDLTRPFESVRDMLLQGGAASYCRNLHYWSAQLFLVFTFLHTWDYLYRIEDIPRKRGLWFRLVLGLIIVLLAMLTGFILKADADSLQARRILNSLLQSIPFAGKALSRFFLGKEDSFQMIYVHHIATASIFLLILIFEHAKTVWVQSSTFVRLSLFLLVLSLFFRAPLHDNLNPVVKGPWYLIGMQEILHYTRTPVWFLAGSFLLLATLYYLPVLKGKWLKGFRSALVLSLGIYLLCTLIGYFFRGEQWKWIWPWEEGYRSAVFFPFQPELSLFPTNSLYLNRMSTNGKVESCVLCHSDMEGFSSSHDPEALGCFVCHRGDPYSLRKRTAHRNMISVPGNMQDARLSCGSTDCHPEITQRLPRSLMNTAGGMVSVDRFVFGETSSPSLPANIQEIGTSAADMHLRNLCAICHLGTRKDSPGPITRESRGGGCNACHLEYSPTALADLKKQKEADPSDTLLPGVHPSLSLNISRDHCFGCHSRSGRISTSYEGWHETLLEADLVKDTTGLRILEDQRVYRYIQEDVHHEAGLDCIDCHTSYGLMGDGNSYLHKEEQVKIQCTDCHFSGEATTVSYRELDEENRKIADLKEKNHSGIRFLKGKEKEVVLLNSSELNGKWILEAKNTGTLHDLKSPSAVCVADSSHKDLHCSACHAAWAPRCIGCHTEYEPSSPGFDMIRNKDTKGSWTEFVGQHLAGPPGLGVLEQDSPAERQIFPASPGMVLSIDTGSYRGTGGKVVFKRLFAPLDPHTTQAESRSCTSCHNDPVALGYGEGRLEYVIEGKTGHWIFTPRFAPNKYDQLPEDAWIGFNQEAPLPNATREYFRPFSVKEQQNILRVGACLVCHEDNSRIMKESLRSFQKVFEARSEACILPVWDP